MADSVHVGERLRRLECSMASISANMGKLLDHYGLPRTTDEEVDRVLAAETAHQELRVRGE